jgi:hypothetical protein
MPDDRGNAGLIVLFSTIMEIIEIPKGQVLVQLSSREILVLWTPLADAQKRMDDESFTIEFKITPARAGDLLQKARGRDGDRPRALPLTPLGNPTA